MPLSAEHAGDTFGLTLLGTPDPDQVLIGAPAAAPRDGGRGAVIVWNRHHPSQLLTEHSLGLAPRTATDGFGSTLWLSTDAANASGAHPYLFVGAPGYPVRGTNSAGAAVQVGYQRAGSPARVLPASAKVWTQARAGVGGQAGPGHRFGSSFQSLTITAGKPSYLVGTPGGDSSPGYAGQVLELGTGRVYDLPGSDSVPGTVEFGASLGSSS
ncbi:MAG TPA: hypothetical protein VFE19_03665 [Jatrophihabitantaceae bacterium]|nr:hypothetical protein [Jatrophihabitantaceae bacterium]